MNEHELFQDVVTAGLACGLHTPQEWVRNYEYHLLQMYPHGQVNEVYECLWKSVVPSLYSAVHMKNERNEKILVEWVEKH